MQRTRWKQDSFELCVVESVTLSFSQKVAFDDWVRHFRPSGSYGAFVQKNQLKNVDRGLELGTQILEQDDDRRSAINSVQQNCSTPF